MQSKLHGYPPQQHQQHRDIRFSDEPEIQSDGSAFCPTTIFIGDLSESIEERELQRVFSRFGRIENIRLIPGKSFGFIKFSTRTAAQTAMTAMNGALVCGSAIRTSRAKVPSAAATRWQPPSVPPYPHAAGTQGAHANAWEGGNGTGSGAASATTDESSVQAAMSVPMAVPIVGPGFSLVAPNMPVLLVPPPGAPAQAQSPSQPSPSTQPALPQQQSQLQPPTRSETPPPGGVYSTLEEEMAAVRGMVVYDE